jgi:hypothetical protein
VSGVTQTVFCFRVAYLEKLGLCSRWYGMQPNQRLVSLDAFRGFVMLLMASSGLGLAQMASLYPDSWGWQQIKYQVSHVPWVGCSLWDLIQPSFMFMVGIAVPLSVTRRKEAGQGFHRAHLAFSHSRVESSAVGRLAFDWEERKNRLYGSSPMSWLRSGSGTSSFPSWRASAGSTVWLPWS